MMDALVTTAEAALYLGVSAALIRKWASRKLVNAVKRGVYRLRDLLAVERSTRQTQAHHGGRRRTLALA